MASKIWPQYVYFTLDWFVKSYKHIEHTSLWDDNFYDWALLVNFYCNFYELIYFNGLKTSCFIKSKDIYGKVVIYWDKLADRLETRPEYIEVLFDN